ncbi:MAG: STAS domain-containing protein [Acidobacteria bacterium]|nr:STAS domain-containing protein [Acidobacteriota bacterium]
MAQDTRAVETTDAENVADQSLLRELVAHLRDERTPLREEWTRRITEAQLLRVMTSDEIFSEVTALAIRELSTPVLKVRDQLLILPIIGALDAGRARQLTEQLLNGIRENRAKVVVIDITGVPSIDMPVADHLVQAVRASALMGARVIITGLSADIAQTVVNLGVDLSMMQSVGDLQGGIEEAERQLSYEVTRTRDQPGELAE